MLFIYFIAQKTEQYDQEMLHINTIQISTEMYNYIDLNKHDQIFQGACDLWRNNLEWRIVAALLRTAQ